MEKKFYKHQLFFYALLISISLSFSATATIYPLNQVYSGTQEVPANASPATGTIVGSYNDVTNTISYTITFSGLLTQTVQGHFHAPANPGVNAPVIIGYTGFPAGVTSGTYSNSHVITDAQEVQLLAGLWYSNLHTTGLPGGEIRAQIILQGLPAANAYTTCPNVDVAVARAGTNANDANPYYLYNVNNITGVFSQVVGGPYKDPADLTKNLQVNAIGVSKKDGFIYGLTNQNTLTTTRFLRLDRTYGVTSIGFIPSPTSPTSVFGFVNSAAGDVDTAGNYYFTGATTTISFSLDKLFLGKISNIGSYPSGAGAIAVSYYEIDISGANCSPYISSLTTDPSNSGLKDFSYNAYTNSFFTYATFKPTGFANFKGQLLELKAIPGSVPLRYQLLCSNVVNDHTAEVSGTAIDKLGRFTVMFTDGSFGVMNRTSGGIYNGTFTNIANNSVTTLPNPLRGDMGSCGQQTLPAVPTVPATCPSSYFLARAGTNADVQNPYLLYTVNGTTGAMTLIPGDGLRHPANPSVFIQVNGIGLNLSDGFFYGTAFEGTVNTAELVRFDKAYGVMTLGGITPPVSPTGLFGFVNTAAGDVFANNYWFTGVTGNLSFISPSGFLLDKLFLGKISSINTLPMGGNPAPQYFEIDYSDANCAGFISTLATDPSNSGLKDLVFNPLNGHFITYLTFKPTGATNFSGQMAELKPIAGSTPLRYKLTCTPVVNSHTAEVSGALIDNSGAFLVMMTDGTVGKIGVSAGQYNGTFTTLNSSTGLPNPLRGDAASCFGPTLFIFPLPVRLTSFTASAKECANTITWTTENEVAFKEYQIEQSTDNRNFTTVSTVAARGSLSASTYKVVVPSAGKMVFYRLKMVEANGSVSYSFTLHIANNCNGKFGFVVNPNPVKNQLTISWLGMESSKQVDIQVINASGSLVSRVSRTAGSGTITSLDASALPAGMYWIKATDTKNNVSHQHSFIKQ